MHLQLIQKLSLLNDIFLDWVLSVNHKNCIKKNNKNTHSYFKIVAFFAVHRIQTLDSKAIRFLDRSNQGRHNQKPIDLMKMDL